MKRGNVSGIISVGIGAIAGTILGLPFLAMKNAIGLLGPVVGVVAGGLLHRICTSRIADNSTNPNDDRDAAA